MPSSNEGEDNIFVEVVGTLERIRELEGRVQEMMEYFAGLLNISPRRVNIIFVQNNWTFFLINVGHKHVIVFVVLKGGQPSNMTRDVFLVFFFFNVTMRQLLGDGDGIIGVIF